MHMPCANGMNYRYIDSWILEKRLSKVPGKAVSSKPFYRRAALNPSVR